MGRVKGSLSKILSQTSAAWYKGEDGSTAYYEEPLPQSKGILVVNGKRVAGYDRIRIPVGSTYVRKPEAYLPGLQLELTRKSIRLDAGWFGFAELTGNHVVSAMNASTKHSATNGQIMCEVVTRYRTDQPLYLKIYSSLGVVQVSCGLTGSDFKSFYAVLAELEVPYFTGWVSK